MRKDVRKVKALIIRKLIRHVAKLKSKKGTEELVLKNQRRAQRLLEEIQTIKKLKPDIVTKTALRKEIKFDAVFNTANSDVETRAVARLATHPFLKQKISAIKDAVKAFKKARMSQVDEEDEPEKPSLPSKPTKSEKPKTENKPKEGNVKRKRKMEEPKLENAVMDSPVVETTDKEMVTDLTASKHSNEESSSPPSPQAQASQAIREVPSEKNILPSNSDKDTVQNIAKKKVEQSNPGQKAPCDSDSSDLEDSDKEDKEYFDDSTEERFLKQGSGFEDSDSDSENDFFIGKLRHTKKKKTSKTDNQISKDKIPPANAKPSVNRTEEQKASTGPKNVKLESVFCTSLAETKPKSTYMKRESKLPPVRNKKPVIPQANTLSRNSQSFKASAVKQQSNIKEEALHPSWEASRKRKEQSQMAVFQGKKIVFDD
ncbi:hypothetical protein GDO78_007610 [Eleutherodactylus coqui]|nr:hypothetical protein GDO78_007610 [Eleutherodactylus coqui]